MALCDVRLVRRETVAEGTMAFHFSKPSAFRHQAGQSVLLKLINPPETDSEGDARTFTLASAPHEAELMIETGFIRRDLLERHVPDLASPVYYFAGPPTMTMAMQKMLEDIGIPEQEMRYEEFYGY